MHCIKAMLSRRALVAFVVTGFGVLGSAGAASAATYTVNDRTDAPLATSTNTNCVSTHNSSCTLRAAVQAADNSGGASTITMPAGAYTLTIASAGTDDPATGDLDIDNNASVTINGAGSGSTTVDANFIDRAFAVQKDAGLTLSGLTIEKGLPDTNSTGSEDGGAIYSDGSLTLSSDVTLQDNIAFNGYGGAIYTDSDQTKLSVAGATFDSNDSYEGGGALYLDTSTNESGVQQSVSNSTFLYNSAPDEDGGAINVEYGDLAVSGSTFTGNSSNDGGGGAVYDDTDSGYAVTLTNNAFDSNSSYDGGALDYAYGKLTASGNTFSRNSGYDGGAIYQDSSDSSSTASVENNTFDHNSGYDGGVLYNDRQDVSLSFRNNTLARNQASDEGGGIYDPSYLGAGSIYANNIVAENGGYDCYTDTGTYAITTAQDPGNNLDSDGTCFGANAGDLTKANPNLGPLADNGGPTETDALLPGSPAINAGNDAQCPSTDQRGVPRPQGTHCDIGAFETAASALTVSNSAPSNGVTGQPFTYTVSVGATGPGPSTGTTVTDQLPAGETLYGTTPSQGSCTSAGSPAKVTCNLGSINNGSNATVTMVVSEANAGSVTDTATATNDQGANVSASATTKLVAPVAPAGATGPKASTYGHSNVTKHSAKLKGHVTNGGQPTFFFFQYGRSRKLGLVSNLVRITSSTNVSAKIHHLLAGKKYFFRLVAVNDSGKSYGAKHHFRTKKNKKHKKHH